MPTTNFTQAETKTLRGGQVDPRLLSAEKAGDRERAVRTEGKGQVPGCGSGGRGCLGWLPGGGGRGVSSEPSLSLPTGNEFL